MGLFKIRPAEPADLNELLTLCEEHADYEGSCYLQQDQRAGLLAAVFRPPFRLYCWVVEQEKELVGYCTYSFEYSTWKAANFIHMDCLYLRSNARNHGLGKMLMEKIIVHARSLDIDEIQWQTPETNIDAMRFYDRMGAIPKKKVRFFLNPFKYGLNEQNDT